jgi:hypothetical protein
VRSIVGIVFGLLLIVGIASAQGPNLPAKVNKQCPCGKGTIGWVNINDTIHSCGGDAVLNVNEVGALFNVFGHVYQSYSLMVNGLKINIQKWDVGETQFTHAKSYEVPKIDIRSNYAHLITLSCVENPVRKGGTEELEVAFRLVDRNNNVIVADNTGASGTCILCSKITCPHCKKILFDGDSDACLIHCCSGNHPHGDHAYPNGHKYACVSKGQEGWVGEGELGVGNYNPCTHEFVVYYLDVKATSEWCDTAGDYECGQVFLIAHPQM